MIEPIKRTLKNFKITRTQLTTTKKVSTTERLAESEDEVVKELKESNYLHQYDQVTTNDVIGVDETYTIEEVK